MSIKIIFNVKENNTSFSFNSFPRVKILLPHGPTLLLLLEYNYLNEALSEKQKNACI